MTPLFDTDVQELKYKVLKEVAALTLNDTLTPQNTMSIAEKIIPDDAKPTMRCCIYKERAIINQRVKLALGGNPRNPNVVEVLPIACDECPVDGITVTQACRGCIAHNCVNACPKNAITIVNRHATIDKDKCVECGRCAAACSYGAILKLERPCIKACKMKAISINPDNQKAMIKLEKCVSCGACVYQCPFGAISDKSFLTKAIQIVRDSLNNRMYHTYAVVAPSIGAQYADVKADQVYEALLKLGFYRVEEAAWGADAVAYHEAQELVEKGFLTADQVTGTYLTSTETAIINFQKANGLTVDGIAGEKTQHALFNTVPKGTYDNSTVNATHHNFFAGCITEINTQQSKRFDIIIISRDIPTLRFISRLLCSLYPAIGREIQIRIPRTVLFIHTIMLIIPAYGVCFSALDGESNLLFSGIEC